MTLTGGFDIVLQMTDSSLTSACTRLHAAGLLSHRVWRISGSDVFEIVFGPPSVAAAAPQADGLTRVVARTRATVRARPSDAPTSAGRSAVAEVTFRGRFQPRTSAANPLSARDIIPIDWAETSAPDIVVHTNDAGFDVAVRTAFLELMADSTSAFIPIGTLVSLGARGAAVCTIPRTGTSAFVAVGLDMGSGAGSAAVIDNALRNDWALGLSRDYIVARIADGLRARFGAVPPPIGVETVELDARTTCVVNGPFGCALTAVQRTLLSWLQIDLIPGRLIVQGRLTQTTLTALPVQVEADWSTDINFDVDMLGVVRARAGAPTVTLSGAAAGLVNFLSGGKLEQTIKDAILSMLQQSISGTGPIDWLDGLIGNLGSSGGISLRPVAVDVRADGIALHGVIDTPQQQTAPVASATVLAQPANAHAVVFCAAGSWSPGGDIMQLAWEPGDGTSISTSGTDCRLAVEHVYPTPGLYTACLAVTDAANRVSMACQQVEVGILRYRLVSPRSRETASTWEICAAPGETVSVDVAVTATRTNIPRVTVTVKGGNWNESADTDARGIARIPVDVSAVQASPATGGSAPLFSIGGVDVEITAPNWIGGSSRLWFVDCAAAGAFRQQALQTRDRWLDRLAGYSELRRIRDEVRRRPTGQIDPFPDVNVIPYGLGAPSDPRLAEASRIGAGVALLDDLTTFIGFQTGNHFASQILGLGEGADQQATLNRLNDLWSQLGSWAKDFQHQYGPREGDRPD